MHKTCGMVVQLQGKTTGRPRKFGPRTLNIMKRQVDLEPSLSTRKLKEMNPDILSHVSMRTLQRRLSVDLEYRRRVARKKPLITECQQRNRVNYAKEKIKWSKRKWRYVLFTDEAIFTVTGNRPYYVRRRDGSDANDPKFIRASVKQPAKLMVWGAIGYHAIGKLIVLPTGIWGHSNIM